MTYDTLLYDVKDRIATITLNRPAQLNAFTVQMANDLIHAFGAASADDDVGALILTGSGRAFCAGMDLSSSGNVFGLDESQHPTLSDMTERFHDEAIVKGVRDTGGQVTLTIFNCRKPVIAAINGPAVGIGATMTLPADFRMVSEKARIGFVFGKIGVVPEACSSWFLPRIVGIQQSLEWVYSGAIFDGAEAHEKKLARSLHAADDLLPAARTFAASLITDRSPVAIAFARQMLWRNSAQAHPVEAHKIDSLAMFYTSLGDGKDGVAAFLEKRPPHFEGRASDMPDFYEDWLKNG